MGVWSGLLFAGLPVAFGAVLIWLGLKARREGRAQGRFATAPGVIVSSSVRNREIKMPILGRRTLRTSGITFGDGPRVSYSFEVDGETYAGTRIGAPPARRKRRRRRPGEMWDLQLFEVGRAVTVHYDPRDPARCVLYPEPTGGTALALFAMGGAFMLFGLMAGWIVRGL